MKILASLLIIALFYFSQTINLAKAQQTSESSIYNKNASAVVYIRSSKGIGSGIFIENGFILTNRHVLIGNLNKNNWESYPIYIELKNGIQIKDYEIIICSKKVDLCVMKLSNAENNFINPKSNFKLNVGEKIFTIGHPKGSTWTISSGIISSEKKLIPQKDYQKNITYTSVIQFNAPISPGNSGGPLLNSEGLLIGVVTSSMNDSQNLNYAISQDEISKFLSQVTNEEKSELILLLYGFEKNSNKDPLPVIKKNIKVNSQPKKTVNDTTSTLKRVRNDAINLYDSKTHSLIQAPDAASAKQLLSTNQAGFSPEQKVPMKGPDGELYIVNGKDAPAYIFEKGYIPVSEAEVLAKAVSKTYSTATQKIITVAEGALNSGSFGLGIELVKSVMSVFVAKESDFNQRYERASKERKNENPNYLIVGNILGISFIIFLILKIKSNFS